jgi:hypothetical protein
MHTSEFRRIKQKFILLLVIFSLMVIWDKFLPGVLILIFILISVIEIFKKKELFITLKIQKLVALFFELIARFIISVVYFGIIIPMGWVGRNRIKGELVPREIKDSDRRLEGCTCDIVFERSY